MDPVLIDFPSAFETERLQMRMPLPGDGEAVHEAKEASHEELKEWMPFAQNRGTLEETEANVREAHAKFLTREDLRLHIFLKESSTFIGSSGLHRINWEIPKFEIGYWIDTRYAGKGYMSEAVEGIAAFAFDKLKARRVEIRCDSGNEASRAIPERLGFDLEGVLRNDDLSVTGEGLRNTCIYAKIR
ncbi:Protein N-acetyltransferase, RimJ/RimL family [Thalassobacillus cyri]|uniref:Protein N-acetyltransferase, RimJ/RimL family n=1 Tax=Thalassobacillus cyri TaxID=571932 RepID=A0A1H4FSA5_9BACI|nr:GNAT family N-acetyltransferase [Thalassobacillus cyri]SEA99558.1 Protein N-acetyltransferase, RimJ/RimL family [Thalassobacillus cyri]